jgi:hypothetical protein
MKGSFKARGDPNARRQTALVDDALTEGLIASFPASDPLSMVNTLIPGTGAEPRRVAIDDELGGSDVTGQLRKRPLDDRRDQTDSDLGITVAFVLVLIAVLLMLHAGSIYSFDLVASTPTNGIVPVPPM